MQKLSILAAALLAMASGVAQAELPVQVAPQFGLYFVKSFGGQQSQPLEVGAKFHYGDVHADIYHRHSKRYRPALFDLRFNNTGLTAFETAGVNVMQPQYLLGASEGGFLSSINWGLVGMALLGAGIYYAAEEDRDDREDRIAKKKKDTEGGSAGGGDTGGEGEGGGDTGGDTGGEGALCDPSGNLGCSPVDPTADGGGAPEGGGDGGTTGTPLDAAVDPVADAAGGGSAPEGGGEEPVLGCDPALGSGQCL